MKVKIGEYAILHGTKAALEHFSKLHPKFKFVRSEQLEAGNSKEEKNKLQRGL